MYDWFYRQGVANLQVLVGTIMWALYYGQTLWIPWLIQIATCGTMTRTNFATTVMLVKLVYWGTSEKNGEKQISFSLLLLWFLYGSMSLLVVHSRMLKQKTSFAVTNRVGFSIFYFILFPHNTTSKSLLAIFLSRFYKSLLSYVYIFLFCFFFGVWNYRYCKVKFPSGAVRVLHSVNKFNGCLVSLLREWRNTNS